jgi:endoglucanase
MARVVPVMLALAALAQQPFYADPAHTAAARYARTHHGKNAALMRKLSKVPHARWFTGGSPRQVRTDVRQLVDRAGGRIPVLVAYDLPHRSCAARGYRRWIDSFADGIKTRPAVVILEPDALAGLCGPRRIAALRAATDRLAKLPNTRTYVDAGHSHWQPAATMARRLARVHARAYALNVANFRRTKELIAYGHRISSSLHFVIDTSRNGRGPGRNDWCNPPRRGLGARPTADTPDPLVDYLLWVKPPGESDGQCRKGPPAGTFWPRYAIGLARHAVPPLR